MKILTEQDPVFLIILFVALASFDHFVTWAFATRYPDIAMRWLFKFQSNPFRWIEYSVSASIMAVAISILSGLFPTQTSSFSVPAVPHSLSLYLFL
jgi:hypothetical protein